MALKLPVCLSPAATQGKTIDFHQFPPCRGSSLRWRPTERGTRAAWWSSSRDPLAASQLVLSQQPTTFWAPHHSIGRKDRWNSKEESWPANSCALHVSLFLAFIVFVLFFQIANRWSEKLLMMEIANLWVLNEIWKIWVIEIEILTFIHFVN